ncbi:MAG: protein kinase [Pirellulaceae bacterium]
MIHRDIKPSNVLVAEYDDRAVPKIIDFGLAKAMEKRLTAKTMFTEFGQIVGTPDYMSPEQAKLNQMDIDTRSDIYSLGVLLYELLSGNTPFDRQRLRSAAFDELLRIIRDEEPPKPSQRLSTVDTLPSIAANRRITPAELTRQLSGELDWIVMKAIEKERSRRYETANGLADDLRRYLNDEPVEACPPSTAYKFRKFARRNRPAIVTSVVVAAALVLGTLGATWQSILATRAHRLADSAFQAESTHRRNAEQQRDRARKAEERAQNESSRATVAADRERLQRARAEEQEFLARRNLYAAHMNLAYKAYEELDLPRVLDLLGRHVPSGDEPDWRSFDWQHLFGLCNRNTIDLACSTSSLRPAFSPDGEVLAVARRVKDLGSMIEFLDLKDGTIVKRIEDANGSGVLAFSPDGKYLAGGHKGEVKLWDVVTGTVVQRYGDHQHDILNICFSPDGRRLLSSDGGDVDHKHISGVVYVWDVATGERVLELKGPSTYVHAMAVSPDGRKLITSGEQEIRLWDLENGKEIENPGIQSSFLAVAWSPDGSLVATEYEGISLWKVATGERVAQLDPKSHCWWLEFSPDGTKLASAQFDSAVRVWDLDTHQEWETFRGHSQWGFYAHFSPDGKRLVSVGRDLRLKVWSLDESSDVSTLTGSRIEGSLESSGRHRMAVSSNGQVIAGVHGHRRVGIIDRTSKRLGVR